jgi:predicted nucleic acid-binding protein
MRDVFADTFYWVAVINPKDQWHGRAAAASRLLAGARIITTDEVLAETLNYFAGAGPRLRDLAAAMTRAAMRNANVEVLPQTRDTFLAGLSLYGSRLDKGYSLTDRVSMSAMRALGIAEVLTHDRHFEQEGFNILL